MTFADIVKRVLFSVKVSLTPQEIRGVIKRDYPESHGTQSHIRNVKKGHYKDLDHALLAQIYAAVRNDRHFICDTRSKPMKVSLQTNEVKKISERAEPGGSKRSYPSPRANIALFAQKIGDILTNCEKYHEAYYKAETFGGPSLYFHQRALETRQPPGSLTHIEYVYATLASWGMHRMGKGGSKMHSFALFRQSVETLRGQIAEAQGFNSRAMDDEKWLLLKEIFVGLRVMASGTTLVGNSKAMHHMLPDIVPPMDREYTLWYLVGKKTITNDLESEWNLLKNIISGFFIPVASNREFEARAMKWIARKDEYPWDTSFMKIVDNIVIGLKKV